MDWDNLHYFLELSRTGKLTAAARRLGVNYTTVARRVQALEKSLDAPLFMRAAAGYSLTEAGRTLLPQAEAMESAFSAIEQARAGQKDSLSGQVRIGATEGYGSVMLAPQLAEFTQRYPNLGVDLLAVPRMVQLSRREADIVITLERPERGPFISTKLTDYVLKLYASVGYLEQHSPIRHRGICVNMRLSATSTICCTARNSSISMKLASPGMSHCAAPVFSRSSSPPPPEPVSQSCRHSPPMPIHA